MIKEEIARYRAGGAQAIEAAVPALLECVFSESTTEDEMYFVASVCIDLKQFQNAIQVLEKLNQRFTLSDVGWNNLAFAYWEAGRERDAFEAYRTSLSVNPSNVSSLRGACYLAIETERDDDALQFCSSFQRCAPSSSESAIWYATALHNCARKDDLKRFVADWQATYGKNAELQEFVSSSGGGS